MTRAWLCDDPRVPVELEGEIPMDSDTAPRKTTTTPRFFCVGLLALGVLAGCSGTDSRSLMLAANRKGDPTNFPGSDATAGLELIKFAHLGHVDTADGLLHVVEVRWRIRDMPAPRGHMQLSFFTSDYAYVGCQYSPMTYPMICRGPYVLMWGRLVWRDVAGNAWDLSDGFASRRLVQIEDGF